MDDILVDIDGLTFEEWAEELFEYERCCECGGDAKDHEPGFVFGHWFAFCKEVSDEPSIP